MQDIDSPSSFGASEWGDQRSKIYSARPEDNVLVGGFFPDSSGQTGDTRSALNFCLECVRIPGFQSLRPIADVAANRTQVHTTRMLNLKVALVILVVVSGISYAQPRRKIIINEDCSGPGGSNMQTLLMLIQSPQVEVLGITVVSGDQWREEEVAHTLRLLEIIGRTDIPVVPGAEFPLVRTREEAQFWQQRYGKVAYAGAWDERWWHEASWSLRFRKGQPTTKPADEDAAHFLIRMVHKYPHEVTIYEGGPMTNLALAISLDPQFP